MKNFSPKDNEVMENFGPKDNKVMENFSPKDRELIYYLQRRIMNLRLPHNIIKDVFLYDTPPHKLAVEYEAVRGNAWYFFTQIRKKYKGGEIPNRAVGGCGYWKATGRIKNIYFGDQIIGHKGTLVFYDGDPRQLKVAKRTNWIMEEFRIDQTSSTKINWIMHRFKPNGSSSTSINRLRHDPFRFEWVVCKIHKKNDYSPKGNMQLEDYRIWFWNPNSIDDHQLHPLPEFDMSCINGFHQNEDSSKADMQVDIGNENSSKGNNMEVDMGNENSSKGNNMEVDIGNNEASPKSIDDDKHLPNIDMLDNPPIPDLSYIFPPGMTQIWMQDNFFNVMPSSSSSSSQGDSSHQQSQHYFLSILNFDNFTLPPNNPSTNAPFYGAGMEHID